MARRRSRDEESYELSGNIRSQQSTDFAYSSASSDEDEIRAGLLAEDPIAARPRRSLATSLANLIPFLGWKKTTRGRFTSKARRQRTCLRPSSARKASLSILACITATVLVVAVLFPSYTHPPAHYATLRHQARATDIPGRANIHGQKVYIAASIFDKSGDLADGAWGQSILGLVDVLGPDNVYLSIYENDAGTEAETALRRLEEKITCDHTITFEKHLSLDEIPHITLPDGSDRVKRITYLSEVRNRALKPLKDSPIRYDKMLYINDVIFDPIEAAQLLFSTNVDSSGQANYRAACAVDFINPFKYYDTFATRDLEGYGIGLPFFPWFTSTGAGDSKKDVLAGSDAVRVRSCWGGMVAFDARFFQSPIADSSLPPTAGGEGPSKLTAPFQFRAEDDLYWDASECCLIHADIQNSDLSHPEIYMNPYVRVAYDKGTLSWLSLSRRFERLYTPVHYIISKAIGMPWSNPRQREIAGDEVEEKVWVPDPGSPTGGEFRQVKRTASHSGFCGRRALQVLKKDITGKGKNWEFLPVPG